MFGLTDALAGALGGLGAASLVAAIGPYDVLGFAIVVILCVAVFLILKWAMVKFEVEEPLRTALILLAFAVLLIWLFGYGGWDMLRFHR